MAEAVHHILRNHKRKTTPVQDDCRITSRQLGKGFPTAHHSVSIAYQEIYTPKMMESVATDSVNYNVIWRVPEHL